MDLSKVVKDLFRSNNIDWENRVLLKNNTRFSSLVCKNNQLDLEKIKNNMPNKNTYYNNIKGFLSEYLSISNFGVILNQDELKQSFYKNMLKYELAPKQVKDSIKRAIDDLTHEINRNKEIPNNGYWLFLDIGKKRKSNLLTKYKIRDLDLSSQFDVAYKDPFSKKWVGISFKSTNKNKKNFGLKNTTPNKIDPEINQYIKKKEYHFWKEFNLQNKTLKEKKNILENNHKLKSKVDYFWQNDLSSRIIDRIILLLEMYSPEELFTLFNSTIDINQGIIIGSVNGTSYTKNFNDIQARLDYLKNNKIKINKISNTTLSLGDLFKVRLKYANGNLASSVKMQIDFYDN